MATNGWQRVRAKDHATGDHYTTTRHLAEKRGDQILEGKPALDANGNFLPRKKNITPAPATKAKQRASEKNEAK